MPRRGSVGEWGGVPAVRPFGQLNDPRRRVLIQALAAGVFSSAGSAAAQLFGTAPRELPPGQSIYRVSARALVNDRQATMQTPIRTGDTVETAPNAELLFVVAEDACI